MCMLTDWIALIGLGGLAFYRIETWKIRRAAQSQLEALQTPCLTFSSAPRDGGDAILEMDGARGTMVLAFHEGDALLTNIGNGPAVNIEYVFTAQGDPPRKLDGYVSSIPPGARVSIPVARNTLQGRQFVCSIQYDSLSFARYETKMTVHNLVLTPPFSFGKVSLRTTKS